MLRDASDSTAAAQSFLLVAPAAANPRLFGNFTRIVNDYLEQPPFNFVNRHKDIGVYKKVTVCTRVRLYTLCSSRT